MYIHTMYIHTMYIHTMYIHTMYIHTMYIHTGHAVPEHESLKRVVGGTVLVYGSVFGDCSDNLDLLCNVYVLIGCEITRCMLITHIQLHDTGCL